MPSRIDTTYLRRCVGTLPRFLADAKALADVIESDD